MSLKLKTILGVALIEAVLLALLVTLMMDYLKSTNYDGLYKRATTTAALFATTTKDAVLSYDLASLEVFAAELIENPDLLYARVVASDGSVFAEAGDTALLERQFRPDSDVSQVTDGVFDVSASIQEGGERYGEVQLGIDISVLTTRIEDAWRWSALIAMGEMVLVALFSFLLGSYLTGQLGKLRAAAHAISRGESGIALDIDGRDEVAEVANAFNKMSQRLQLASDRRDEYEQDLKALNSSLESRVEQRTAQLSQNILQLKETNEALKKTRDQLVQSEKMASIGTLAAGVAHEINNPVGFVMSNVRTLSEYMEVYHQGFSRIEHIASENDPARQKTLLQEYRVWQEQEDLAFIKEDMTGLLTDTLDGTERIRDIVSGLKEFSHTDQASEFKAADLIEAVQQTLKVASNEVKYKAEVVTRLDPIPLIRCNSGQIRQVLLNLIVNASQAIDEHGRILVRSGLSDGRVFLSVTDNGSGIAPDTLKKIFEPFFTTKEVGEGTGLGLAIAYGIMEEHGGEITVQSVKGRGTRFSLLFPVSAIVTDDHTSLPAETVSVE